MGHNLATWKTLEEMMIELKKKGVTIPSNIMEDLRAAKSMIRLSSMDGSHSEAIQKTEEFLANVEAFLVTEIQKVFNSESVDKWLQRLEEASAQVCEELPEQSNFITGVPKDQKWVRIEPTDKLTIKQLQQIANEQLLKSNLQKEGRLLVYGNPENIKKFLKKITAETAK